MRRTKCFKNILRVLKGLSEGEGTLCLQERTEVGSVDKFHHQEALAVNHALIKNRNDSRRNDSRGCTGLAPKTRNEISRFCQVWVHDLERNWTVQTLIVRDVDGSHTTARKAGLDPISLIDEQVDQWVRRRR